jgi:hypothetical protein
METEGEDLMDWKPCKIYGVLGRVDGMNEWPRSCIMQWMELSRRADDVMRMQDGPKKKSKLSMISSSRNGIIKYAEDTLNGQKSGKDGGGVCSQTEETAVNRDGSGDAEHRYEN